MINKQAKNQKKIRTIVVVLLIAVVIGGIFFRKKMQKQKMEEAVFETLPVSRGKIVATVSATGKLKPVKSVEVGSQVSGRLREIFVEHNQRVKNGQLLAKIDSKLFEAELKKCNALLDQAHSAHSKSIADFRDAVAAVRQAEADIHRAKAHTGIAQAEFKTAQGALESARSLVKRAEAELLNSEQEFRRAEKLWKEELISRSDYEKFQTAYMVAKANLESEKARVKSEKANVQAAAFQVGSAKSVLQAAYSTLSGARARLSSAQADISTAKGEIKQAASNVDTAKVNLKHCYINSPIDGIIVDKLVEPGQTIAAAFQTPRLFMIARDLKKMEVKTDVSEADIGKIKLNQPAVFDVDTYPGESFRGTVTQIRITPSTEENVVVYRVIIRTGNEELKLKPGMTANVRIVTEVKDDILRVPKAALRFSPEKRLKLPEIHKTASNKREESSSQDLLTDSVNKAKVKKREVVWVFKEGEKPKPVFVETGISDDTQSELLKGSLKEGTRLVTYAETRQEKLERVKSGVD